MKSLNENRAIFFAEFMQHGQIVHKIRIEREIICKLCHSCTVFNICIPIQFITLQKSCINRLPLPIFLNYIYNFRLMLLLVFFLFRVLIATVSSYWLPFSCVARLRAATCACVLFHIYTFFF